MAAILVHKANPLGIELLFYANTFFCFIELIWPLVTWVKTIYKNNNRAFTYSSLFPALSISFFISAPRVYMFFSLWEIQKTLNYLESGPTRHTVGYPTMLQKNKFIYNWSRLSPSYWLKNVVSWIERNGDVRLLSFKAGELRTTRLNSWPVWGQFRSLLFVFISGIFSRTRFKFSKV